MGGNACHMAYVQTRASDFPKSLESVMDTYALLGKTNKIIPVFYICFITLK